MFFSPHFTLTLAEGSRFDVGTYESPILGDIQITNIYIKTIFLKVQFDQVAKQQVNLFSGPEWIVTKPPTLLCVLYQNVLWSCSN